ncbi:MAG: deoxyadenosine/deoxycytidine kinase [Cellvibrionaceae bacterium]|jgi:deoxyadenosine/deoxycytidine kinase
MKIKEDLKIAIVGPCSSGKSTLRKSLLASGYLIVKNPTQEHSYVKDMWQRITNPDVLIYLDVDYPATLIRRPHIDLGPQRVETQNERLAHAREHADFYLDTSLLTPDEISEQALQFLQSITL